MSTIYDPASDGELNLDRAQRWIWNYTTFLTNPASAAWANSPICITFKKESIQKLLTNYDADGNTHKSAGIRLNIGMYAHENALGHKENCFLQLAANRVESELLFEGNEEMGYNDAYVAGNEFAEVYAFDQNLSSHQRQVSPLNPVNTETSNRQQVTYPPDQSRGYPVNAENVVTVDDYSGVAHHYFDACAHAFEENDPFQHLVNATTITGAHEFHIHPNEWARSYFFEKDDIINNFGDPVSKMLNANIRVYFGITDQIDADQTGEFPGRLKLIMIGANELSSAHPNDDIVHDNGEHHNHILDFSRPCPNICGEKELRLFEPTNA